MPCKGPADGPCTSAAAAARRRAVSVHSPSARISTTPAPMPAYATSSSVSPRFASAAVSPASAYSWSSALTPNPAAAASPLYSGPGFALPLTSMRRVSGAVVLKYSAAFGETVTAR